jgi:enamine deaminase RidA (YjgF/YER057c/UK114 family)
MSMMQILQPPSWAKPKGFANGIAATGTLVFVAGQVGWTGEGKWEARDFAGQFKQALKNCIDVVAQAGGTPQHIVRLTWYVTNKQEYLASLKDVGTAYRALMGRHFPVMAVVQVSGLIEPEAKLEIEATAVVPPQGAISS